MQDSSNKNNPSETKEKSPAKKEYNFGGIQEFSLEKIEEGILEESVYLDVFAGSDLAFKENIQPLENVLSALKQINCISYDYKNALYADKGFPTARQVGVVAQEVKSVFPELVRSDKDGDLQVNYSQLSTIALSAVKELATLLEKSNERIAQLEIQVQALKK